MRRRLNWTAVAGALALAAAIAVGGSTRAAADSLGGPVIIGGDDLTDHGEVDDGGKPALGWLYIQRALESISPRVTRANDGSVAALGSERSDETDSDAGAAIGYAAAEAGLSVNYYDGEESIRAFFAALEAGTAKPRIVWIAGNQAPNDLGDGQGNEAAALTDNATKLANFVNSGGGLMSHGTEYGWLFALLPDLTAEPVDDHEGDLRLTPEGTAAFPGLSDDDLNDDEWHNFFQGDLGGLQVLVNSIEVKDTSGNDAAVIIGGAAVQLPGSISLEPATATNQVDGTHTVSVTVRESNGAGRPDVEVTFSVTAGPNAGETDTEATDEDGQASFTYTGAGGPGTDTIEASFVDETQTTRRATATAVWETSEPEPESPPPPAPAPPPPPATPPDSADLTVAIKQEALLPEGALLIPAGAQPPPPPPAPTTGPGGNGPSGPGGSTPPGTPGTAPPGSSVRLAAAAAVPVGTRMRYLLTITNNGPSVARDVRVSHQAPAGSSFDSATTDKGSCSGSITITCDLGNLSVGQQAHVEDIVTLRQGGPASTTARVTATGRDPAGGNNMVSAAVDVSQQQPVPPPSFGGTANPELVSGFVCVQVPSSNECVDITTLASIPIGSIVDARAGRVRLTVARADGTIEIAELFEGMFQLLQTTLAARSTQALRQAASVTEFRLVGGDFSVCTVQPAKANTKKAKKKRKPAGVEQAKPRQPVRRLWGDGDGSFRTRGRYSSATVRGTIWLTQDYCSGTLVRVREGSVTVRDLVKNRTVVVTAGESYFAEAPGRKTAQAKKAKPKRKPAGQ